MEKRNFYRLSTNVEIEFAILDPVTVELLSDSIKGILHDLSGGGLSFSTDTALNINQLLEIKLLSAGNIFHLIGRVVRKIQKNELDIYAVEFVHLDRKTQDQLVQLVFNMERRQRNK